MTSAVADEAVSEVSFASAPTERRRHGRVGRRFTFRPNFEHDRHHQGEFFVVGPAGNCVLHHFAPREVSLFDASGFTVE